MLEQIEELRDAATEDELAARLGGYLGLEGPLPRAALRRAVVDERFARYLVSSRGRPDHLALLLTDRRNERYAGRDAAPVRVEPSTRELVAKAGRAAARWARRGFETVDAETFEARFAACQACEHLIDPPDKVVYKVRLSPHSDPRICGACGCVAIRKARLPDERCPVADADRPGVNRWGQALGDAEAGT
jgi:hypothetical protein